MLLGAVVADGAGTAQVARIRNPFRPCEVDRPLVEALLPFVEALFPLAVGRPWVELGAARPLGVDRP